MTDPAPRSTTRVDRVGLLAALAMSVALVAITARVAQLQLAPEKQLQEALRPHVTVKHELPVRGDILDRRGRLLAATKFGWKVVVDPTLLPESAGRLASPALERPREVTYIGEAGNVGNFRHRE